MNFSTPRMIWSLARAYPGRSAAALLLLLLAGVFEGLGLATVLPLLSAVSGEAGAPGTRVGHAVQSAFDAVSLTPTIGTLLFLIAMFLVLKGIATLWAMSNAGYTVAHVTTDLRLSLIRALMHARWSYFVSQPTGQFANAITSEAERSSLAYMMGCKIGADTIQILIYSVIALFISWKITLVGAVLSIVIAITLSRLISVTRRAAERQTHLQKTLLSRLTDGLQGIKPLKAMAREDRLGPLLEAEIQGLNGALRRQVISREGMLNLPEPLVAVFLLSGLYIGIVHLEVAFETLFVLALLFHRTSMRLSRLQSAYQRIAQGESAYWSLRETIGRATAAKERTYGEAKPTLERALRFEKVYFSYGEKAVLSDAYLTIAAFKITTITGRSGAGKTTIADLIIGLYHPDQGEIFLDETPLSRIDLHAWRRSIGYVPQETLLFHDTILENVLLADPSVNAVDAEAALRAAGAWEFVCELPDGLNSPVGERGAMFSGGQRQRIAIARALVRKPKLLILDEATSSLDATAEGEICATLRDLTDVVTIVAMTHQRALVEAADVVYQLDGGIATLTTPVPTPIGSVKLG